MNVHFIALTMILGTLGLISLGVSLIWLFILKLRHEELTLKFKWTYFISLEILSVYELCSILSGFVKFSSFFLSGINSVLVNVVGILITILLILLPILFVCFKNKAIKIILSIIELLCLIVAVIPVIILILFILSPCM